MLQYADKTHKKWYKYNNIRGIVMKNILRMVAIIVMALMLSARPSEATIEFTDAELDWIENHQLVRYAPDIGFGPIEYVDDDGSLKGASIDYLDWISTSTGITFEPVIYDNWSDVIEGAQAKAIDLIVATKTAPREEYLIFTEAFIAVPNVIITQSDWEGEVSLEGLSGAELLVLEDYAIQDYIEHYYPDISLLPVLTIDEGISRVSLGTDEYMAVSLAQASYFMKEKTITNLKVSGDTHYDNELSFAVRDDWKILRDIIDKALLAMPAETKKEVYSKWVHLETGAIISREAILGIVALFLISVLVILLVLFFNHILRLRVAEKTEALAKLNDCLEAKVQQRTSELVEAEKMASLGRMVIGVSHQLNTPIGSAISAASLIEKRYDEVLQMVDTGKMSKDAFIDFLLVSEKATKVINGELNKAKTLIEHFGELSSTIKEQDKKYIKLNNYLNNLIGMYKATLNKNHISVHINCDSNLVLLISRVYLDNIFKNLISNSIQHGFKNLENGQITIDIMRDDTKIYIDYRDDGLGIDQSLLSNVYEPLFTTSMGKTTGIGLNILYNTVVVSLKGEMKLNSDLGQGVQFYMSFKM